MFGEPQRNTNDGVQALLAIAHGRIHRNLKTPKGQQVPGRYDFDPAVQKNVWPKTRQPRLNCTEALNRPPRSPN